MTSFNTIYFVIKDYITTDRKIKGWRPEDVLKIKSDITCLKKAIAEIFQQTYEIYLYTPKFRLLDHVVEDLEIF